MASTRHSTSIINEYQTRRNGTQSTVFVYLYLNYARQRKGGISTIISNALCILVSLSSNEFKIIKLQSKYSEWVLTFFPGQQIASW